MTQISQLACKECGAIYEVNIWDLGFRETDQINCECCGETLKSWRNGSASYLISRILREGSFRLTHKDWQKFKGKTLRFTKGEIIIEGKVLGLDESVLSATNSPEKIASPWCIETESGLVLLFPDDGYKVRLF